MQTFFVSRPFKRSNPFTFVPTDTEIVLLYTEIVKLHIFQLITNLNEIVFVLLIAKVIDCFNYLNWRPLKGPFFVLLSNKTVKI
jgi:hypothetical protein